LPKTPARQARDAQYRPQSPIIWDKNYGGVIANPWRVVRGAEGHFGWQIDTKPGLCRQELPPPDKKSKP
jgi:hypothetical protein